MPDDDRLSPRERHLVAITAATAAEPLDARVDAAVADAVASGTLAPEELAEAVLHIAVYAGWPRASHLEMVLGQVSAQHARGRGEEPPAPPVLEPDGARTGVDRRTAGLARFEEVNGFPSPPCDTPYRQAVVEWVFGDLWCRPGLNRRDRRLISITCVALTGAPFPLSIHVGAAVTSGDIGSAALADAAATIVPYCSPLRADALTAAVAQAVTPPGDPPPTG